MAAPRIGIVVLIGVAALASPRAFAAEPHPVPGFAQAPLEIHAERLDLDLETHAATMNGRVTITKGELVLRCPHVDVRYAEGAGAGAKAAAGGGSALRVTWVRGSGGVVAEVKGVRAEAPEVEVDVATQTMVLHGGVRVTRGDGWITAERATVQLATGKVSMTEVKGSLPVGTSATSATSATTATSATSAARPN